MQSLKLFFGSGAFSLLCLALAWNFRCGSAGMEQFLVDSMYTIQSGLDRGFLTLRDSPMTAYKIIQPEKWNNDVSQKWLVRDFQSIGLYDFTPALFNTTANRVTFEPTKNVYTYKKQWNVTQATVDKFLIINPESGWCLTNMGSYKEVDEKPCVERLTLTQLWKFRMVRK